MRFRMKRCSVACVTYLTSVSSFVNVNISMCLYYSLPHFSSSITGYLYQMYKVYRHHECVYVCQGILSFKVLKKSDLSMSYLSHTFVC